MTSSLNFSLLDKVLKICKRKKKTEENVNLSLTWLFYSKGGAVIIAIGFFVIFAENLLDKNTMQCFINSNKEYYVNYVVNFCWIHGTHYIEKEYQGIISPCIIHDVNFSDKPITQYYLWLHYVLALLFVLSRLPYEVWKRYYSNNIISILKADTSEQIISNFFHYRYLYKNYHLKYSLFESLNLVFLVFSFIFTHIVLNQEFFPYGYNVLKYVFNENALAHPACHIFPTEVNCRFKASSVTGHIDEKNFLCILTNNLFNQIFFFVLWIYWVFTICISLIGLLFRILRFNSAYVSKQVCLKRVKNPQYIKQIRLIMLKASDWFVFEELINTFSFVKSEAIINQLCKCSEYNETLIE